MITGRRRIPLLFIACLAPLLHLHAQEVQVDRLQSGHPADTIHHQHLRNIHPAVIQEVKPAKLWMVAGSHAALWTGSLIALNKAWYAGFEKSSFHFFNDNGEWQQMDKAGHSWTAYQLSRHSTEAWQWTGITRKKSAWMGGLTAMAYQGIIEIQDAYSAEWGFSWGDMAANAAGVLAFVAQDLAWNTQRIQIKLGYTPYEYSSPELRNRRNQLFGSSLPERLLKDYNSQTYWLSANLHAFAPDSRLPRWLNMALGYNARGMLTGADNSWKDPNGKELYQPGVERTRHFFLAPDIDFTRIRTRRKWLRTVFFVVSMIKVPAPALELNSKGKLKAHALYW